MKYGCHKSKVDGFSYTISNLQTHSQMNSKFPLKILGTEYYQAL